jgi:hypothetical protein
MSEAIIQLRPYQDVAFDRMEGMMAYVWRRQSGKSFTLGCVALDWMMEAVCDVIFASAAIRLGTENIRKEAEVWRIMTETLRGQIKAGGGYDLTTNADNDKGELLDVDAIADLFEHQKLETRLWHNRSQCSRSLVVAPNPDTAVGWTGHVIMDEVGRIPDFRDVYEAMEPIVSANQNFRIRLATTPPPDDSHYSYELLAPPAGSEFKPNEAGDFYESEAGLLVHRVDAWDGYEAGVPLYNLKSREPQTPEEHRALAVDRTAWDRNYGLKFISGGAAAISRLALMRAQEAGADEGFGRNITDQLTAT